MLFIVSDARAPLPPGTFVYRYDQGYRKAIMRKVGPHHYRWFDDASEIFIPHAALDPFVLEVTRNGRGSADFKYTGEITGVQRKRTFLDLPPGEDNESY